MSQLAGMSIEVAKDELCVQTVILESLLHESLEGVDEDIAEAEGKIAELKAFIGEAEERDEEGPEDAQDIDGDGSSGELEPFTQAAASSRMLGNDAPETPAGDRSRPASFTTPLSGTNIWETDSPQSLPSRRKRDVGLAAFGDDDGPNKSRRDTPSGQSTPGRQALAASVRRSSSSIPDYAEIIDLTGDDDADNASFLDEQAKLQRDFFSRAKQEKRDHDLALQLSSQSSPSSLPATTQGNAFTRLMDNQRLSGADQSSPPRPSASSSALFNPVTLPPRGEPSLPMPGAFNPDWENSPIFPSSNQSTARGQSTQPPANGQQTLSHHSATPQTPGFGGSFTPDGNGSNGRGYPSIPGAFPGTYPGSNGRPGQSGQPASVQDLAFGQYAPWNNAFTNASSVLNSSSPLIGAQSSLGNIINNTSMFDYSRDSDGIGGNLPDRLTHFLQDAVHDTRISDRELDDLLQNIRPDMEIPAKDRGTTPPGLRSTLYAHQEVALTWMSKMEEGTNKGGILADDMGLGKTISTLALMLSRKATRRPKTNLIIGPLSLITQWEDEIRRKIRPPHQLSVMVYHNRKATTDDLLKYDVVLTTYGTIAAELKRLEKYEEENSDRNVDPNDGTLAAKCPLLHPRKAKFYRVILDEAQCIKNQQTRTAKACFKLRATYRWCLTGTPMMNGVHELYSIIHFLQIKPYCEWDKFRPTFGALFGKRGSPKHIAMGRLRALLKAVMLRRKKNSKLDGKPILRLPEKTENVVHAELSHDELDFYKQLEEKSRVVFNKYLREGSVSKNYTAILVLLLRLRQACCHPHLNLDLEDAVTQTNDEMLELVKTMEESIIRRIKSADGCFECPICMDAVPSPSFFVPCGHDSCSQCLTRLADSAAITNLQAGTESDQARCPVCRGPFDPKRTFTYDAFRAVHMPETILKAEVEEPGLDDDDSESDSESEDGFDDADDVDRHGNLAGFVVNDESSDDQSNTKSKKEENDEKPLSQLGVVPKKKRKGKKKAAEVRPSMLKQLRKEASKNRAAFKKYMRYLRRNWVPAAKVTECMSLLREVDAAGEKTIVFSQWTLLLDLLEVAMHHEHLKKPVRYDGSMSGIHRANSADQFRSDKNAKVMLVSLRAGNAGLNLTSASRVIIMDPFWNPYIEMQAVDRAYRIGQTREVKVYRILTKETIEDRIEALKEKKKEMIEAALDEAEGVKIGRLGVTELKFLFNGPS